MMTAWTAARRVPSGVLRNTGMSTPVLVILRLTRGMQSFAPPAAGSARRTGSRRSVRYRESNDVATV